MHQRTALLQAVREATQSGDGSRVATAVARLAAFDKSAVAQAAQQRELVHGQQLVARRFEQGPANGDRHTWATDWLADESPRLSYRVAMRAEAATWVRGLHPMVLADSEELTQQALGRARTAASAYGEDFQGAYSEFLSGVTQALAASGLPQIDQVVDPDNQPSATPYPTEVFDNFAPEQNDYNGGVESPNRQSAIDSNSAPMFQQIHQQDGSGSGFGSGPEVEDHHDTAFNPGLGYAEVPLGPAGTIPSAGPGQGTPVGQSAPTPVTTGQGPMDYNQDRPESAGFNGQTQNSDDERGEHKTGSLYYSVPDPHGFRWLATRGEDIYHPYHEVCAASHWPDEDCSRAIAHTASVAIGYSMNLDEARRIAQCESIGAREGLRALAACRGSIQQLAGHHNRVAAGYGKSARTMEDTAVLHGFQAVVRPVLADSTQGCEKCRLGASTIVDNHRFCGEHGRQYREAQHKELQPYTDGQRRQQREARDFSQAERDRLTDEGQAIKGKLPVDSHQDLENAEHLKGKVKGIPEGQIDSYMHRMEEKFGKKAARRLMAAAALASGLDFQEG